MSVGVQQLSKIYGQQKAVDNISFEVKQGEIVGFLGPNGAGKSTTMKIITCFIPQSEGEVSVCGYNIKEAPLKVRENIGYLPENNPLYYDMYVKEYLGFIAKMHKLNGNSKERIQTMIERTGLEREQHKKIGQLSKGYKQRVGLAQAMIHDPKVLILDEPTSGLDPNQLVDIRNLIKDLGKEKTVILSTHIMQEVQAMCDRIIIINKGKLVADNTTEQIQQQSKGQQTITIEFDKITDTQKLTNEIPEILQIDNTGKNTWRLLTEGKKDIRKDIFDYAVQNGLVLLGMYKENSSIEDVFRELTK